MSEIEAFIKDQQLDAMRVLGRCLGAGREPCIEVFNPYTERRVGTVPKASLDEVRQAYQWAYDYRPTLTRHERASILNRCAALVRQRLTQVAELITAESGLSINDATYEAGRVSDVLLFGAQEVLKDDGQIFSCDLTPHGKKRRVYTQRSPLLGVITAITPFNHPMNQVAHKVIPSIATNNRMVLKPSEKVPFSALYLAQLLYESGLPPPMLQVITGDPREIADEMLTHPRVDLITFTGGVAIGKYIAAKAGYRYGHRPHVARRRPPPVVAGVCAGSLRRQHGGVRGLVRCLPVDQSRGRAKRLRVQADSSTAGGVRGRFRRKG